MSRLRGRVFLWLILSALPAIVAVIFGFALGAERLVDQRALLFGAVAAGLVVFAFGAGLLVLPLLGRLERTADTASSVAKAGSPPPIADRSTDELGEIARSLDRISEDRDHDRRATIELGERFRHLTGHDSLTGIANRQALTTEIERALRAGEQTISVLLVDVDDFRLVNELFGHTVGDEVLVAVANRLRRLLGDEAIVGRWGADEYLLVLRDVDETGLAQLATRVRALFDEPINTVAGPHPLACSVGVSTARDEGGIEELLGLAEAAVQEEKEAHRRVRSISPETTRLVELALRENRLEVWYQPIVRIQTPTETQMVGAEAFVRLRSDDDTLRVPSDFLAEIMTSRYAREIDQRMAGLLLADLADWQRHQRVGPAFFVSLNLSPASLRDAELGRSLADLCREFGVSPERIVLDVSEEAADLDQITAAELRREGFRLSIDDLGLKRSNFDRLFSVGAEFAKLHRRWLDDDVMLDALIGICQRKGLHVVAEGVETMDQLDMLFARGVELCQGYVISRPMSSADFGALLGAGRPSTAPT